MSRSLPAEQRRNQLLDAARMVFARDGYHRAGVSDIIEQAGVARGTFYNYFDSKRAIFHEVLVVVVDDLAGSVQPIDVGGDILAQARANVRAVLTAALDPQVARLLLAEAVGVDEEGDEVLRAFYGDAVDRIQTALELGRRLGVVREGDLRVAARCVLGMVKENVFLGALMGQQVDPDAVVDEIYAFMTQGLLKL
ncbi:MAG: TetR/AcrR family transcriptional regulator [Alphaproteobacteria bacterium]|nr:TetR/AcrR family transcriptional regulator [Alphaproteobacteria bacterium]